MTNTTGTLTDTEAKKVLDTFNTKIARCETAQEVQRVCADRSHTAGVSLQQHLAYIVESKKTEGSAAELASKNIEALDVLDIRALRIPNEQNGRIPS
jgi:hypothetical protein